MRPEDEYRLRTTPQKYSSTPDDSQSERYRDSNRQRSGCLTIWLALYVIFAVFSVVALLPYVDRLTRVISPLLILLMFVDVIAQGVGAYLTLQWKRRGVQLLIITMILSLVIQGMMGTLQPRNFLPVLFGLGVLAFFVGPHWDDYED